MDATTSAASLLDTQKQRRGLLGFRSSKRLQFPSPSGSDPKKHTSPTSPPTSERSVDGKLLWPSLESKQKPLGNVLPERLRLLDEFYSAMEASISLLNIRRATCSFSAVAMAVENSTQRRFLRKHLAQIKYILPDTLKMEEFKSWNSDTQSYCKDLRITLLPISTQGDTAKNKASTQMVTRIKEFHRRLIEFVKAHPQDHADVPEADVLGDNSLCFSPLDTEKKEDEADRAILSHTAFNPSQLKKLPRSPSAAAKIRQPTPSSPLSHFPSVFKRHFSARANNNISSQHSVKDESLVEVAHIDSAALVDDPTPSGQLKAQVAVIETVSCHENDSFSVPSTPQKSSAHLSQDMMMSPPNRSLISVTKFESQTPCSILANPFASPICSTPYQDVSTPLGVAAKACQAEPVSKTPQNSSRKQQKQAVIKSLRFGGTPSKGTIHDDDRHKESHAEEDKVDADISVNKDAEFPGSPIIRTRPGLTKSKQAISRVLPFNSPKRPMEALNSPSPKRLKMSPMHGDVNKRTIGAISTDEVTRMLSFNSPKRSTVSKLKDTAIPSPNRLMDDSSLDKQVMDGLSSCLDDQPVIAADCQLTASDMEMLRFLPKELLDDVHAKERKLMDDSRRGVEEARRRKQMIAGLPKLFNAVRLIFQSADRTVFTCKDLTRMLLSSHPDITDQGEIIEQLQLLVDFAPQWISANHSSRGERVYRISKGADMKRISKVLSQAV